MNRNNTKKDTAEYKKVEWSDRNHENYLLLNYEFNRRHMRNEKSKDWCFSSVFISKVYHMPTNGISNTINRKITTINQQKCKHRIRNDILWTERIYTNNKNGSRTKPRIHHWWISCVPDALCSALLCSAQALLTIFSIYISFLFIHQSSVGTIVHSSTNTMSHRFVDSHSKLRAEKDRDSQWGKWFDLVWSEKKNG